MRSVTCYRTLPAFHWFRYSCQPFWGEGRCFCCSHHNPRSWSPPCSQTWLHTVPRTQNTEHSCIGRALDAAEWTSPGHGDSNVSEICSWPEVPAHKLRAFRHRNAMHTAVVGSLWSVLLCSLEIHGWHGLRRAIPRRLQLYWRFGFNSNWTWLELDRAYMQMIKKFLAKQKQLDI